MIGSAMDPECATLRSAKLNGVLQLSPYRMDSEIGEGELFVGKSGGSQETAHDFRHPITGQYAAQPLRFEPPKNCLELCKPDWS
jgi:hypothetical protein